MDNHLLTLSPLDGRYAPKVESLSQYFSDAAVMRYRILILIEWNIFLVNEYLLYQDKTFKPGDLRILRSIYEQFDSMNGLRVLELEKIYHSEVVALEKFVLEQLDKTDLGRFFDVFGWGFSQQSIEDLAYKCMFRDFVEREYLPVFTGLVQELYSKSLLGRDFIIPFVLTDFNSIPTVLGKELINFVVRIEDILSSEVKFDCLAGNLSDETGFFALQNIVRPEIDWGVATKKFIQSLGLRFDAYAAGVARNDELVTLINAMDSLGEVCRDLAKLLLSFLDNDVFAFSSPAARTDLAESLELISLGRGFFDVFKSNSGGRFLRRNLGQGAACYVLAVKNLIRCLHVFLLNKKNERLLFYSEFSSLNSVFSLFLNKKSVHGVSELLNIYFSGLEKELASFNLFDAKSLKSARQLFVKDFSDLLKKNGFSGSEVKHLLSFNVNDIVLPAQKLIDDYQPRFLSGQGCGSGGCTGCQGCGA